MLITSKRGPWDASPDHMLALELLNLNTITRML
jgi:ribosomal protein L30/L7E